MSDKTYRSTAWSHGHMQWHMQVEKQEDGKFKAHAPAVPNVSAVADDESGAINQLKMELRDKAFKGEL